MIWLLTGSSPRKINDSKNSLSSTFHSNSDLWQQQTVTNYHLRVSGWFCERVIIISPKKEFAQANQLRVLLLGLITENDSWLRLSVEWALRLSRQFLISSLLSVVRIWVTKARGQMLLGGVWELPIPLISPLWQKQGLAVDRMKALVFKYVQSVLLTNYKQGRESKEGKLASSNALNYPLPFTQQAKIFFPATFTTPYSKIADLMDSPNSLILNASISVYDLKIEFSGSFGRTSLATKDKQVDSMALPGTLQARSLGSSDGLKPVFIIPVRQDGRIFPSLSSFPPLQNVQKLTFNRSSYALSLLCYQIVCMSLLSAFIQLMLTKSIELYLL